MTELNYPTNPEDSIPPVVFEPEDSEAMRNLRDLYILQEMFHYLIILVQQDLPRLQEIHTPADKLCETMTTTVSLFYLEMTALCCTAVWAVKRTISGNNI